MERLPDHSNLQRLLALKRHETPPPGYFEQFPAAVIARIRAGERGEEASFFGSFSQHGWLGRLLGGLEMRSALAGTLGIAVCGVLLAGLFHSDASSDVTAGLMHAAPINASVQPVSFSAQPFGTTPGTPVPTATLTNPLAITQPTDSLFHEVDRARALQLIDFKPGQ